MDPGVGQGGTGSDHLLKKAKERQEKKVAYTERHKAEGLSWTLIWDAIRSWLQEEHVKNLLFHFWQL